MLAYIIIAHAANNRFPAVSITLRSTSIGFSLIKGKVEKQNSAIAYWSLYRCKTSGQVIWHKTASPPQMDGWIVFARWRQCALPGSHVAHWHLANSIELALPLAHPCPQPKATLSLKLPHLVGDLDPHLIHDSLGPSEPTTETASRSVQLFCRAH